MKCTHPLHRRPNGVIRGGFAAVLTLLVAACGGGGGDDPDPPAVFGSVQIVSGDGQTGSAGTELANPLVARVLDTNGNAIPGHTVTFVVSAGGGSVFAGTATSDAGGLVRERWTLGTTLAAQRVEIRANAATLAQFTATSVAGAAAALEKDPATENQAAQQTQQLPSPLAVYVRDTFGNPKTGVTVTWTPCADCGSVAPTSSVTNQNGEAQTQWTLGQRVGTQTLTATVTGITAASFAAESLRAPPSAPIAMVAVSGNGQSINQHAVLPQPVIVQVTDALGNGVPGVTVDFASGGSTSGYITPSAVNTDADGFASYAPYVHVGGAQQLAASTAGLPSITFDINVAANPFRYDGFYQCFAAVNGSPNSGPFVLVVTQDVLSGSWGEGNRRPLFTPTFDPGTGAMTGILGPSLDTRYHLTGNLTVDADEIGGGQGTFAEYFIINPTGRSGVWSCTRY